MEKEERPGMIKCSHCSLKLPESDLRSQINHMENFHPEAIFGRLREAGLHSEAKKFSKEKR